MQVISSNNTIVRLPLRRRRATRAACRLAGGFSPPGVAGGLGAASKPLAVVGGITLLERAVAALTAAGIDRVVVVGDSLDGPVAWFCRGRLPHVEVVCAHDCARGNGATVLAGLAYAGGRCLVTMVDHLHEPATVRRLLAATGELVF